MRTPTDALAGSTAQREEPPRASPKAIAPNLAAPLKDRALDPDSARGPTPEFLRVIPHEFARRHLLLSAGAADGHEVLRVTDRTPAVAIFNVGVALGVPVITQAAAAESLASAIDRAYEAGRAPQDAGPLPASAESAPRTIVEGSADLEADLAEAVREAEQAEDSDVLRTQGKAPAIRLVDLILFEAIVRGASDVHIQPVRGRTLVRYRLDGVLRTSRELPGSMAAMAVSRVKVMSRLDVAEQRAPQDGRASVSVGGSGSSTAGGGRRIDLRVGTLPSTYGERVVIRLLDPGRSPHLLAFAALGMPEELERAYLRHAGRASGIVLSTGPTGSGKTTTLYATLAWLTATNGQLPPPPPQPPRPAPASPSPLSSGPAEPSPEAAPGTPCASPSACELNILTIEDPVEYDLSTSGLSVSQTQVDPRKGLTFASGLRHILRQDPDVIMVGEIRDEETARIAVQASLTGHLVLSTLHTNDAPSAITRLIDLGVEPFLVASSLSGVLAQRLVRKTHSSCAGHGCNACLGSGFSGRVGVFELLSIDTGLRDLVGRRVSAAELRGAAVHAGMVGLREAGEALVARGITTRAEVARVIETLDEQE